MHPVPWHEPVTITDIVGDRVTVVENGARTANVTADALVALDHHELARRGAHGLRAVTSLGLLDALLNLPLDVPVDARDMARASVVRLREAPAGVVDVDGAWFIRRLTPPGTVTAAVVRGDQWRSALDRAASFSPFAQQIVVLRGMPGEYDDMTWEAQLAGIGVWLVDDTHLTVLAEPHTYVRKYWKAAGWRFAERALDAWLTASCHPARPSASAGRRARLTRSTSDQLQPS